MQVKSSIVSKRQVTKVVSEVSSQGPGKGVHCGAVIEVHTHLPGEQGHACHGWGEIIQGVVEVAVGCDGGQDVAEATGSTARLIAIAVTSALK